MTQGKRRERAPYPCRSCFLGCKPKGGAYPCSAELRVWAQAHRHDRGDALGYVWEQKGAV